MRRVFTGLVFAVAAGAGCVGTGRTGWPSSPAPTTSTAVMVTMPDVVGPNADVAADQLHERGFTHVDLGTVDGRPIVVLPQKLDRQDTIRQGGHPNGIGHQDRPRLRAHRREPLAVTMQALPKLHRRSRPGLEP
ncbi:hypothetical protein [Actinoplanes sp. NPDC049316]|uniref:hypothetical protein n=1 Tax=Actinoplanes sp. NPDC049316 TaxID=3154727 RepID=UPI0034271B4B